MGHQVIDVKGDLFIILRTIKEDHNPVISAWEEHLHADKVFRKDGLLFFCRQIEDAKIISEENGTDIDTSSQGE